MRFSHLKKLLFILIVIPQFAYPTARYEIEGQYVLLYKIINWWYSCDEHCNYLCGKEITMHLKGKNSLQVNKNEIVLTIEFAEHQLFFGKQEKLSNGVNIINISDKKIEIRFKNTRSSRIYIKKNLPDFAVFVCGRIMGISKSRINIVSDKNDKSCDIMKSKPYISIIDSNNKPLTRFEIRTN